MQSTPRTQHYRADIDGLRAIAVLPVVFYHAGIDFFTGGFVGVDVFFVISGYLITSIIVREIESNTFTIRNFYARRARRLFPALFAVLITCCCVAPLLLMPEELEDFGQSVATTTVFVSNFLFFTEAGYFAGPAELKPLLHTWSLAIEEQYYLLFPGLLILIHRYSSGRFMPWVAGLLVLSIIISIWSVAAAPDAAFYLLPSRTWELMLGSLLALTSIRLTQHWMNELGGWIGLLVIGAAVVLYDHQTAFPGVAAMLPCVGAGLIVFCGTTTQPTTWSRLLSWYPIVFVGLISYSLYLWHWPILVFAKHYSIEPLGSSLTWGLIALAFLLAALSWRFVEQPFRGKDGWLTQQQLFKLAGAAMVALIAIGMTYDEGEGFPERLPDQVLQIAMVASDRPPERKRCEGVPASDVSFQRMCRINRMPVEPSFAVWGDSHAMAIMNTIGEVAATNGRTGLNFSSNGCAPLLGVSRTIQPLRDECLAFAEAVVALLAQHPEITDVILAARWARHALGTPYGSETMQTVYLADEHNEAMNTAENLRLFQQGLDATLQRLAELNKNIIVLGPVPEVLVATPNAISKALWRGVDIDFRPTRAEYESRQQAVLQAFTTLADQHPFNFYDLSQAFCSDRHCEITNSAGLPLYADNNHLSSHGSNRLMGPLNSVFEEIPP